MSLVRPPTPINARHAAGGPSTGANEAIEGIYIHTPFCVHKCHYCDFYSLVDSGDDAARRHAALAEALVAELKAAAERHRPLRPRTIFVGGGTPTLLGEPAWRRLLEALQAAGVMDSVEEFTVEANPESTTPELMRTLAAGGVNRISIGCQSFQPAQLKALERWHEPANVARAIDAARAAGIENINLDMIFAIPDQSPADLDADLEAVLALEPRHVSYYSLIFEPHTPLTMKMKLGQIEPVDDQTQGAMYETVIARLAAAGFEHYEVSNWARAGRAAEAPQFGDAATPAQPHRCLHNLLYWRNANWLGLGPSAASHVAGRRWKNEAHLSRYLAGSPTPPIVDEELSEPTRSVGEALMMGLRLREGVSAGWLEGATAKDDPRHDAIVRFQRQGLLARTGDRLHLTRAGLFVADALVSELL